MKIVHILSRLLFGCSALLCACSAIPSIQNCENVLYARKGLDYHIEADCRVSVEPVSIMPGVPGL